ETSTANARERYPFFNNQGNRKTGPLRHLLKGYWSRRINEAHRRVYRVKGDVLMVAQLRTHYGG
ncbi:MAG: type II toxin-antitoxin system YoeB family toxin, partial [Verrucomicrobia bacterium]|nr:type II toxin-antitoxin system YoeB family toxin [Verrucomicrobiota bacterium]